MSSNENWSSSNVLIVPLTTCFIVATFRHCLKNRNGELKRIGGRNSFPKWERVRAPFFIEAIWNKGNILSTETRTLFELFCRTPFDASNRRRFCRDYTCIK